MEGEGNFQRAAGIRESKSSFQLFDRLSSKLKARIADIRERTDCLAAAALLPDAFDREKDGLLDSISQAKDTLARLAELNATKPIVGEQVDVADIAVDEVIRDKHQTLLDTLSDALVTEEDRVFALSWAAEPLLPVPASNSPSSTDFSDPDPKFPTVTRPARPRPAMSMTSPHQLNTLTRLLRRRSVAIGFSVMGVAIIILVLIIVFLCTKIHKLQTQLLDMESEVKPE